MKYMAIAIGYMVMWSILLPYLIIERGVKYIIVIFQILWHLRVEREWFYILKTYLIFIPPCYPCVILMIWRAENLKDYFLLRNYKSETYIF